MRHWPQIESAGDDAPLLAAICGVEERWRLVSPAHQRPPNIPRPTGVCTGRPDHRAVLTTLHPLVALFAARPRCGPLADPSGAVVAWLARACRPRRAVPPVASSPFLRQRLRSLLSSSHDGHACLPNSLEP